MKRSRKIRVVKRDGSEEAFDCLKLARSMWLAMRSTSGRYYDACQLSAAIETYLIRRRQVKVTSEALFNMATGVLRRAFLRSAAEAMEEHRCHRARCRRMLYVRHSSDHVTLWEKGWLAQLAGRMWFLSPAAGRILADQVEQSLLAGGASVVERQEVVGLLNRLVAEYGLADAVPFVVTP